MLFSSPYFAANGVCDEYHVIRHCMNLEAVNTYEGTYVYTSTVHICQFQCASPSLIPRSHYPPSTWPGYETSGSPSLIPRSHYPPPRWPGYETSFRQHCISHVCQTARCLIIFMCTLQLFFLSFLSLKEHTMFMPSSSEEVSRGYQPSNRGLSVPAVFVETIQ